MQLRQYTLIALPFFVLHMLEEYLFDFIETDASIGWLANMFDVSRTSAYWSVQILLYAFLLWMIFARPVSKAWYVILGIIFAVELTHLWEALVGGAYVPGFWTAIPLVVLGVLFWKELFRREHL
ncbi:hypothetical protein A3D09_03410 [Candidatus Collierbacteria bacterium RIFCSPHIGHO2_02_FULL_49_10]|uniref:HXXEE domain-containing protein n=1 Tax=Candidatus Collierbacteria bacterium RIFCSPHIGHO2_02_FULL_49_10 TaxID=1817723 RepID=A0A1F5ERQ4_9BACT|nr:MAG: hypothetical protein A3D09_03410 [Candidatus Collierbacteria bacterium RIFCSPHIGHO2_02_FULL_49_10]